MRPEKHEPTAPQQSAVNPETAEAAALLRRLQQPHCPPFALLRRRTPGHDPACVDILIGTMTEVERLEELPVPAPGAPDHLALVPFRQIRERGFDATEDGTPLSVLLPRQHVRLPLAAVTAALPGHEVRVTGGRFDPGDDDYAEAVRRVVAEEIGTGEGANFVIRRNFLGEIPGWGPADALALFGRLLAGERGAYWTFAVHTGDRTLLGASPEVHVRMTGGTVVLNPISGTYRYPASGPDIEGLLEFLDDRKEREELSMVVDEELKMMCRVGHAGGTVVGPRLREMAHLAHTEYELRGRSTLDVREVLRETMFAATVTGSPLQNACRVISRYEPDGRGYYAGALALLGRDAGGAQTLDSPILIRTADIDAATGRLRLGVGATLVRGSRPESEVAETHAKAAGVLAALGVRQQPAREGRGSRLGRPLADDPRVRAALDRRRAGLAPFWLRMQRPGPGTVETVDSPQVMVVDGEDTFTAMLAHLLRASGRPVTVRPWNAPGLPRTALSHPGPVVLGPGPGDPSDPDDPRIRLLRLLAGRLLANHPHGVLGVCLGHELLAAELGLPIVRKAVPLQGAQEVVDLFGRSETVGFYNSYTARCDEPQAQRLAVRGIELSRDPVGGEVHALRGPGFAGVQFHPESVLTLNGAEIAERLLTAQLV